jgi:hypothetical protein
MAITQAMCTSFKAEVMLAVHDFRPTAQSGASTFKLALYTSSATLSAATTAYTATGETSGTNYTAGGAALTNVGVTIPTAVACASFNNLTFSNVTLTARGALIYNSTPKANSNANTALTNPAVCVLDFGADTTTTAGNFTIVFPAVTDTTAIIRIA